MIKTNHISCGNSGNSDYTVKIYIAALNGEKQLICNINIQDSMTIEFKAGVDLRLVCVRIDNCNCTKCTNKK